jgi:plastocyanin
MKVLAAGGSPQAAPKSSPVSLALIVAIVALIVALAGFGVIYSSVSSVSGSVSSVTSKLSSYASVNVTPAVTEIKVDWCNTDNTGQDRFCPASFTVIQGDIVQILFQSNDTDVHTFSLSNPYYNFQINDSFAGGHNFLTNGFVPGNCVNSATFAQEQAGISGTYCVSGTSLLSSAQLTSSGASDFAVAQNPNPGLSLNGTTPVSLPIDDQVHFVNTTASAISFGVTELWGDGAFQATTPGIYEYYCVYHESNGMFGYMIVLPNAYCNTNPTACNIAGTTT